MQSPLKKFKIKWKAANDILNALVDAINARGVSAGAGIHVQHSPLGNTISLQTASSATGQDEESGGSIGSGIPSPPTGTASWQTVSIVDNSTGVCVTKTMLVWGTTPT
jgi:hypothetical protein